MPLTQNQIDLLNSYIYSTDEEDITINSELNEIIEAREDIQALLRIHENITNENCGVLIQNAKDKILASTNNLITLLS